MTEAELLHVLESTGLPARYSHFENPQEPPFLVYIGDGQDDFSADNLNYWHQNTYSVQYIYKTKAPAMETMIEDTLTAAGLRWEKSEDVSLDSEGVYYIEYTI